MGAYGNKRWPANEAWRQVVKKRHELVLCPQYRHALRDECIMALVFGNNGPLFEKILAYSLPAEYESVIDLFADKISIKVSNGNLIISN